MSRLGDLYSLRNLLRLSLNEATPGGRAPLSAEYRKTLAEIEAMEAAATDQKGTVLDELKARRRARRTGTEG